jgi:hypothetical protein
MHPPVIKLVETTNMVEMKMRRYTDDRSIKQIRQFCRHRRHSDTRVHDQITITATHMPYVATDQAMDMRLPQLSDPVSMAHPLKPPVSDT